MAWKDLFKGMPQVGRDPVLGLLLGTNRHAVINAEDQANDYASVTDTMPNGRVIYVDTAGYAKITYFDDTFGEDRTEVIYLNAGVFYQIRNCKAAWKEIRDGVAATAKIMTDAGELKIGVKVRR